MPKLTDKFIKQQTPPAKGNKVYRDTEVTGLGLRITAGGHRSFVFNYRIDGRERRLTIGPYGVNLWTLTRARKRAGELRRMVDLGDDPLAQRIEAREAPNVNDLSQRFDAEHISKLRPSTAAEYRSMIRHYILPEMGNKKVKAVTFSDVDALHRKITKSGKLYRANRVLAVVSKMFSMAIRWQWRMDNPARGIERNQETARKRYLSADELARLATALDESDDTQGAAIFRLLLLSGARAGEVMGMRWDQVNFESATWTKPAASTKQNCEHQIPLSAPALLLLSEIRAQANGRSEYVFPGRGSKHRINIHLAWVAICKSANIEGVRIHDLRHSYASVLVSSGLSLPIIGALLGHTLASTTQRYAHLADDPLRKATETAASVITGNGDGAEIVPLRKGA